MTAQDDARALIARLRECDRCDSAGWLHRHELDDETWDGHADDTHYTCSDCQVRREAADALSAAIDREQKYKECCERRSAMANDYKDVQTELLKAGCPKFETLRDGMKWFLDREQQQKASTEHWWKEVEAGRELLAAAEAEVQTLRAAQTWQDISTANKTDWILVAMIEGDKVIRVSEAKWNQIAWYDRGGHSCFWATHWMRLPPGEPSQEPTS